MAVKYKHSDVYSMYFCTFTCYNWLPLISITNGYDMVYSWFHILKAKQTEVIAYVIMPNHIHCVLYFPSAGFKLNNVIGNAKRFMAYEIVKRLEKSTSGEILDFLKASVSPREYSKGQRHKVFISSFDAKPVFSEKFLLQKLNYIHQNPVAGKWKLAKDFTAYEHSSASYYEGDNIGSFIPKHFRDV